MPTISREFQDDVTSNGSTAVANEDSPLLRPYRDDGASDEGVTKITTTKPFRLTRGAAFLIILNFSMEMSEMILIVPFVAMYEQNLCRSYYKEHDPTKVNPDGSVLESLCKVTTIQRQLASLRGWHGTFNAIPGTCFLLKVLTL